MNSFKLSAVVAFSFLLKSGSPHDEFPTCTNHVLVDREEHKDALPHYQTRFPSFYEQMHIFNADLNDRNQFDCCMRAVDQYLSNDCKSDDLVRVDRLIFDGSNQFPCMAEWRSQSLVTPKVEVSYSWAVKHCHGWSGLKTSRPYGLMFIDLLPPILMVLIQIFVTEVDPWTRLFRGRVSYKSVANIRVPLVVAIIFNATTIILCIITSFLLSGPRLLSCLFELELERKVLRYLQDTKNRAELPSGLHARLLFILICGHSDGNPTWCDAMNLTEPLDKIDVSPAHADHLHLLQKVALSLESILVQQLTFVKEVAISMFLYSHLFVGIALKLAFDENLVYHDDMIQGFAAWIWWINSFFLATTNGKLISRTDNGSWRTVISTELSVKKDHPIGQSVYEEEQAQHTAATARLRSRPTPIKSHTASRRYVTATRRGNHDVFFEPWDGIKHKQDLLLILFTDSWFKYQRNGQLPLDIQEHLEHMLSDAITLDVRDWIGLCGLTSLLTAMPSLLSMLAVAYPFKALLERHVIACTSYVGIQMMLLLPCMYYLTWGDEYWMNARKLQQSFSIHPNIDCKRDVDQLIAKMKAKATSDESAPDDKGWLFTSTDTIASERNMISTTRVYHLFVAMFWMAAAFESMMSLLVATGWRTHPSVFDIYETALWRWIAFNIWSIFIRREFLTLSATSIQTSKRVKHYLILYSILNFSLLAVFCVGCWWYQKYNRKRLVDAIAIFGKLQNEHSFSDDVHPKSFDIGPIFYKAGTTGMQDWPLTYLPGRSWWRKSTLDKTTSLLPADKEQVSMRRIETDDTASHQADGDPKEEEVVTVEANNSDMNQGSRMDENGQTRYQEQQLVKWTCSCGTELSDYYAELEPGSLQQLQASLCNEHDPADSVLLRFVNEVTSWSGLHMLGKTGASSSTGESAQSSNPITLSSSIQASLRKTRNEKAKPHIRPNQSPMGLLDETSNSNSQNLQLSPQYLLLCFPEGLSGVKLHHQQIMTVGQGTSANHVSNDRQLFELLRKKYRSQRKLYLYRWWPKTVIRVSLAHFDVDLEDYVNLLHYACQGDSRTDCQCVPPPTNKQYHYNPRPPKNRPPLGTNYLTHYFQSPSCIKNDRLVRSLNQIPKRSAECIVSSGNEAVEAWGIEFEEGWNRGRLRYMFFGIIAIGLLIFVILWSAFRHDVNGAFGIAGTITTLLAILGGWIVTAEPRFVHK